MPVPFVRMCNTRCKRVYSLGAMLGTAALVLYALLTLSGNAEDESIRHKDAILERRVDDLRHEDILVKVKEVVVNEKDATNDEVVNEIDKADKKLFQEKKEENKPVEIVACDACGEMIPDVQLPYTSTESPERKPSPPERDGIKQISTRIISQNATKQSSTPYEANSSRNRDEVPVEKRSPNKFTQQRDEFARVRDGINEGPVKTNITREQNKRISRVKRVCDSSPYLKYQPMIYHDTFSHIFSIESQKLLFCYIPKVGCSNWKRLMMVLAGKRAHVSDITSKEAHAHNGLVRFGTLSRSQQLERIFSYRKVMFVRDPFSRIVSAYNNKYKDLTVFRAAPDYLKQVARRVIKKYRANATQEDIESGENMTWEEFTDYLADASERPLFDEHWKESYKLCSPCKIHYDFVGKLENIEQEANFVLQNFKFTKNLTYPSSANSHPTNSASADLSKYFTNLSPNKLKSLWDIYKTDYALFDYKKPSFIPW